MNAHEYIGEEKERIARKYLEPLALKETGLSPDQISINDSAMHEIIENYCREPGVRNLQKCIERVYRKTALQIVKRSHQQQTIDQDPNSKAGDTSDSVLIQESDLLDLIGPATFSSDQIYDEASMDQLAGVVVGLAYTPMGGAALYIESAASAPMLNSGGTSLSSASGGSGSGGGGGGGGGSGAGSMTVTGSLGDVMKESAVLARSVARRKLISIIDQNKHEKNTDDAISVPSKMHSIDSSRLSFFDSHNIHLHVPAGATPKDGPSAGITMACAMLSLVTGVGVKKHTAMTGEVTLNGLVLPVGGIKEKVLAAKRAGIKTMLLPNGNR